MSQDPASRVLNLDLLRLVSALLVLVYHFGFRMQVTREGGGVAFPELSTAAMWLDVGVLIFFAISGYVIALSSEGRTAFEFAVGRIARLWPTFILCATVTAIVLFHWPVAGLATPTLKQWAAHAVMNSRLLGQPFLDGAYWTIAYEVIFYGWVFLFIAAGWFNRHWLTIVATWLLISVVNEFAVDSEALRKLFVTEYSGYFVFGMGLYRLRRGATRLTVCVLAASVVYAAATPFITEHKFFAHYAMHRDVVGLMLLGPVALSVVSLCVFAPTLPVRPRLAVALGGLTYPLYLLHQNIGYAMFAEFGAAYGRWLVAVLLLAGLLAASWLIASVFEPAARRIIRRCAASAVRLRIVRRMATT